jgi:predicted permease
MRIIAQIYSFLSALLFRRSFERDIEREWLFHMDSRIEALTAAGLPREEAERRAHLEFGDTLRWLEQSRDARGLGWIQSVGGDIRYSLRQIHRAPGFTLAAVATLAIGIGANAAVFSVVNAVLLKPLPYFDAERLVEFVTLSATVPNRGASPAKFNIWRKSEAIQDLAAYWFSIVNVMGDASEQVTAGHASWTFFRLFGAPLMFGRTFTEDEDAPSGARLVVLSEGFWKRRFGGDHSALGRTISLNGEPHVIIGVLGQFDTEALKLPVGPPDAGPPEVWLPSRIDPTSTSQIPQFVVVGRLKRGVPPVAVNAELQRDADEFRQTYPAAVPIALGADGTFGVRPFQEIVVGGVRTSMWVLAGAVGFVLLIACANVTNLLLSRAAVRRREIAIRTALGAARMRIIRQLLTETLLLSMLGGTLGVILGAVARRAVLTVNAGDIPRIGSGGMFVGVDGRVLAFTAVVSVGTALIVGLIPALGASRSDFKTAAEVKYGTARVRGILVVSEIGLAVVLLIGAALMMRTFVALVRQGNSGDSC